MQIFNDEKKTFRKLFLSIIFIVVSNLPINFHRHNKIKVKGFGWFSFFVTQLRMTMTQGNLLFIRFYESKFCVMTRNDASRDFAINNSHFTPP